MSFKKLPWFDKPREKALKLGLNTLSNTELLAIFLNTGNLTESVSVLSEKLLEHFGGLNKLILEAQYQNLINFNGIGPAKALKILAITELFRRVENNKIFNNNLVVNHPTDLLPILKVLFNCYKRQENFFLISLNMQNHFLSYDFLFRGSQKTLIIDLRQLFETAFFRHAQKIICIHNHPSDNVSPSKADLKTTAEIADLSAKMNLILVDHIIFSVNNQMIYSMSLKTTFDLKN